MRLRPALGLLFVLVVGCRPSAPPVSPTPALGAQLAPAPVDGVACVGAIDAPPPGAHPVVDEALLQAALGPSGAGKLCTGRVYEATAPLVVYRVWNVAKAYTEIGRWWSFALPGGTVASYRAANAICPEWSELDTLSRCALKVGARFVLGPGQSADCAGDGDYRKSPVNQVYVDNDVRAGRVLVEACAPLGPWPGAGAASP